MKNCVYIMMTAALMLCGCATTHHRLSSKECAEIAREAGLSEGRDLRYFKEHAPWFDPKTGRWSIIFQGKNSSPTEWNPGFTVCVNDATGKITFVASINK